MKMSNVQQPLLSTSVSKFDHNTVIKILLINYTARCFEWWNIFLHFFPSLISISFHFTSTSCLYISSRDLLLTGPVRVSLAVSTEHYFSFFIPTISRCRQIKISRQPSSLKQRPRQRRRSPVMRNTFRWASTVVRRLRTHRQPTRWWSSSQRTMMSLKKCSRSHLMPTMLGRLTQFSRIRPLIIIGRTHSVASQHRNLFKNKIIWSRDWENSHTKHIQRGSIKKLQNVHTSVWRGA